MQVPTPDGLIPARHLIDDGHEDGQCCCTSIALSFTSSSDRRVGLFDSFHIISHSLQFDRLYSQSGSFPAN